MATCTATIVPEGEGHTSDEKGVETATRTWRIVCSAVPTFDELVASTGIARFQSHPQKAMLIARGHTLKPVNRDPLNWELTWTFSNAPLELTGNFPDPANSNQHPNASQTQSSNATSRLPTISLGRREVMVPITHDAITGAAVSYTTGEPIDPPLERRQSMLTVTVNYKTVALTVAHIVSFFDTVNASPWNGFNAQTLLVVDYQAKTVYETVTLTGATEPTILSLIDATVVLDHNPDTHAIKVLNKGRRTTKNAYVRDSLGSIISTTTVTVNILDDSGQPVQEAVPLKADNTRALTVADFYYLTVNPYLTSNFDNLLL